MKKKNPTQRAVTNEAIRQSYERYRLAISTGSKLTVALKAESDKLNVTTRTLRRYYKKLEADKLSLPVRKSTAYEDDEKMNAALGRAYKDYRRGLKYDQLVEKYKISKGTLSKYFNKMSDDGKLVPNNYKFETFESLRANLSSDRKYKVGGKLNASIEKWLEGLSPEDILMLEIPAIDEQKQNNETKYQTASSDKMLECLANISSEDTNVVGRDNYTHYIFIEQ